MRFPQFAEEGCDENFYLDLDYTNEYESIMNYIILATEFSVFIYLIIRLFKHLQWCNKFKQSKTHVIIRISIILVIELFYQMVIHVYNAIIYEKYISKSDYFENYRSEINNYLVAYNNLQLILVISILGILCYTSGVWLGIIRLVSHHAKRFRFIQIFMYVCMGISVILVIVLVSLSGSVNDNDLFFYQHLFCAIATFFVLGTFLFCCIFLLQRLERILQDNQFIKYLRISIYLLIISGLIRIIYNIISFLKVTSKIKQFNSATCRDDSSSQWALYLFIIEVLIDVIPMICISYLFSPTSQPARNFSTLEQDQGGNQYRQMQDNP